MTDEQYGYLKDGGFTGVIALMERTAEHAERGLTLSDKFGLEYWIRDEINWNIDYDPTVFDRKADFYKDCEKHKSFAGIFITDEPDCSRYPELAELKKAFDKFFNSKKNGFYVNLLPTYANDVTQLGAPYPEYIQKYIDIVDPDHVCFDHYPFEKKLVKEGVYEDYTRRDYLYNLDVVAKACDKAGKEMWTFIQAKDYTRRKRDLTKANLAFQIYANLSFGSKAIVYYTYWSWPGEKPNQDLSVFAQSVISAKGVRLPRYFEVKEIHADVARFSETFMDYSHKETCLVGEKEPYFKDVAVKSRKEFSTDEVIIVGEFFKGESRAFMVVNAADDLNVKACSVNVKIVKGKCWLGNAEFEFNAPFTVCLPAGQGMFITEK